MSTVLSWLLLVAITLPRPGGQAQELGVNDTGASIEKRTGPGRPISTQVARTWIALHETMIRPLPDQTPLRQILRALRDATRGKAGWREGVEFRVVPESLLEAEVTLEAPVTLPFVERPELSVDVYLKYLLREFHWERYVGEGFVIIDSPCDDGGGYATVSAAEAHTWAILHEVVPLELRRPAPLAAFLSAITRATTGKGRDGRGLVIYPSPHALRAGAITMQSPVVIDARPAELGDLMRKSLKPLALALRVLPDGTAMLTERREGAIDGTWDDAFPEYRFSYSFVWNRWVEALGGAARAPDGQKHARKPGRPQAHND
jgi:hypothetical protein